MAGPMCVCAFAVIEGLSMWRWCQPRGQGPRSTWLRDEWPGTNVASATTSARTCLERRACTAPVSALAAGARASEARVQRVPFVLGLADHNNRSAMEECKDQVLDERVLAAHAGNARTRLPA